LWGIELANTYKSIGDKEGGEGDGMCHIREIDVLIDKRVGVGIEEIAKRLSTKQYGHVIKPPWHRK
jgi:hypothetical protein